MDVQKSLRFHIFICVLKTNLMGLEQHESEENDARIFSFG